MAIAKALGRAAKTAGKFLKEKGKQAVSVSRTAATKAKPTLAKAKDVTTKAGTKIKLGAKKAKDAYESGIKLETIQGAKGKVTRATQKVKEKAQPIVAKTKEAASKVKEKAQPVINRAKDKITAKASTLKNKARRSFVNDTQVDDFGGGNMADMFGIPKANQSGTFQNDILGGYLNVKGKIKANPKTSAAIGALAAGALTASIIKSSTPKESEYDISRLRDGRFSTQFKDKNANVVFSAKQLNSKEVDDVRTQLAILDSIVLSDNPKARRSEFIQIATYLADQYKISNITGNNLSLIIPNVEGGVQTRRRV